MLSIIAVIGKNRELGKDDKLLWHVPGDLPRFKKLTDGHAVIMGRKTFQSIGKPLPGRTNIVISRNFAAGGVIVVSSLDEAIGEAKKSPGAQEIFFIGGGSIYAQTIDRADRLYLTQVDKEAPDADTFFPDYARFNKVIYQKSNEIDGMKFIYTTLEI